MSTVPPPERVSVASQMGSNLFLSGLLQYTIITQYIQITLSVLNIGVVGE